MLTWKHNLPVTVDDVVKHSASLLLRISQLLRKHYETHLLYVRFCLRMLLALFWYLLLSVILPVFPSLMNWRDICCFDTGLMLHDVTPKLPTGGSERPAGQFNSQAQLGIYRSYSCTLVCLCVCVRLKAKLKGRYLCLRGRPILISHKHLLWIYIYILICEMLTGCKHLWKSIYTITYH